MNQNWPWVVLALLGAYHGLNPAMGWLFALALGLQEKRRSAVGQALLPIALGHAAAIAVAILLLQLAQSLLPAHAIKWGIVAILLALGLYRLLRASHPRGSGMRVGGRDLAVWSFLMASGHGAGLMLLPLLLARPSLGINHVTMTYAMGEMMPRKTPPLSMNLVLLAVLVHTAAMLTVAGALAFATFELYDKAGLKLLRRAWINLDLLWAIALVVAAVSTLLT